MLISPVRKKDLFDGETFDINFLKSVLNNMTSKLGSYLYLKLITRPVPVLKLPESLLGI